MKKFAVFFIIIMSLLILISCNSKKETPPPQTNIILETPVVEIEETTPEQSWKETLLSKNEISTQEDIEAITAIIEKAVENNNLEELQTFLETEAVKDKVPPQILFGLSLIYGRKGLVKEEYKIIEKLEEQVKQRPGIAFNLSLVYGRKATLKSQIDKAEAEALALLQGFISVTSEPEGADVYIEGELKGTTPFTTESLGEGSYSVEIWMEDYTTVSLTALVKAGKTTEVVEELVLLSGSLLINSDPAESTVLLNGVKLGVTPLYIPEIDAGKYELIISKNKYSDELLPLTIEPGKNESIKAVLKMNLYNETNFVFIQGGSFQMGAADGHNNELPISKITISNFYMAKYEVSQLEYKLVVGNNPSDKTKGIGDNYPVNTVSWEDAVQYCNILSENESLAPCYFVSGGNILCDFNANGYRLPTEAEWEFAAKGGNLSKGYIYSGGNEIGDVAWYIENSEENNHPVGLKQMNELGLYDMSGNVWEWCWDKFGNYSTASKMDYTGPTTGSQRVDRGGSRGEIDINCRSTYRSADYPPGKYNSLGFRVVRRI